MKKLSLPALLIVCSIWSYRILYHWFPSEPINIPHHITSFKRQDKPTRINRPNTNYSSTPDSYNAIPPGVVTPDFNIPGTVCVNAPVNIVNTSTNATSYYWNFCVGDLNAPPAAVNIGNPGGYLNGPVFMDYVYANNNYYGFLTNYFSGDLVRLDFGNSLLNIPAAVNMGNFGGILQPGSATEGIQMVQNEGNWYALIVGGNSFAGTQPRIVKIEFGADITNPSPVATNWGNIGNMNQAVDLHVFKENNNWYGFTINAENNTITRFDFTNSFNNTPTAINLGNIGNLSYPTGIYAINDNGFWRVFIVNGDDNMRIGTNSSITRLDFGNSLLNTPIGVNLGNPGNMLHHPRDFTIMKFCGQIIGFAVNGNPSYNDIVRLDFNNNLSATPTITSLGNIGSLDFPHSISKLFRVNDDVYTFITNVANNTITRLRFQGCTNASISSSNLQNPPAISYSAPGTYNINLTVDDGLPTQASICKQIVVTDCNQVINEYTEALSLDRCTNSLTVSDASGFKEGDTVLLIQMKGAIIDSTNSASFGSITDYKNSGNYEFNYISQKNGNNLALKNTLQRTYDIPQGKVQLVRVPYYESLTTSSTLTCLPWDGSKGGILAFNVHNALTLNADLDVSGRGFSGGNPLNSSLISCNEQGYYYDPSSNNGAQKGEGIHSLSQSKNYGRGAPSNAGGGGNAHNTGGGGGANGGAGGNGGDQWSGCKAITENVGGKGGKALANSPTLNKLYLGGGGGIGHANDQTEHPSGNGGGIIILSSGSIIGNSHLIKANGTNAAVCQGSSDCSDGMGGGGGGGSILLDIVNVNTALIVEAKGGKGADQITTNIYRHGPGGGGGGGFIALKQAAASSQYAFNVTGGINGILPNFSNDPYGASPGSNGVILKSFDIATDLQLFKHNIDSIRFTDTVVFCREAQLSGLAYVNTGPIISWQWDFGDNNSSSEQKVKHLYPTAGSYNIKLIGTDENNCKDSASKTILLEDIKASAEPDTVLCEGSSPITLHGSGGSLYTWSPAALLDDSTKQNPVATVDSSTRFFLSVKNNTDGCMDTASISVGLIPKPLFKAPPDTSVCVDGSVQLKGNNDSKYNYSWIPQASLNDPSSQNPIASPASTTQYILHISEPLCGFDSTFNVTVTVNPNPIITAQKSNDIDCIVTTARLSANGADTYQWMPALALDDPGKSNPLASIDSTTTFIVQGTDTNGCYSFDTLTVKVTVAGKPLFVVPNAFTPNGDGINDCFGIQRWGNVTIQEFSIYNRWGQKVFSTQNPSNCWDGTFKGKPQDAGGYPYIIRAKSFCGEITRTGIVILIR